MTKYGWGDALPVLESPRVRLRPLRDEDVPALFEIFGDADAMKYWSHPPLADLDAVRTLLSEIRAYFDAKTLFQWGIALAESDRLIGTTTLFEIDDEHRRCGVGLALARSAWGKGYASEAFTRIIRFAFETLDLHRIEADPDPDNIASIKLCERQGFKREGLLRERYWLNGQAMDAAFYGLLRSEWTPFGASGVQAVPDS